MTKIRWKTEANERKRVTGKGQNALSADVVDFVNSQVLFTVLVALGQHPFLLMTVIRHVSSPPTAVPFPHSP